MPRFESSLPIEQQIRQKNQPENRETVIGEGIDYTDANIVDIKIEPLCKAEIKDNDKAVTYCCNLNKGHGGEIHQEINAETGELVAEWDKLDSFDVKAAVEQDQYSGVIKVQEPTLLSLIERAAPSFEPLHSNQVAAILYRSSNSDRYSRNNLGIPKISRSDFMVAVRLIRRYEELTEPMVTGDPTYRMLLKRWKAIEDRGDDLAKNYRNARREGNIYMVEKA